MWLDVTAIFSVYVEEEAKEGSMGDGGQHGAQTSRPRAWYWLCQPSRRYFSFDPSHGLKSVVQSKMIENYTQGRPLRGIIGSML